MVRRNRQRHATSHEAWLDIDSAGLRRNPSSLIARNSSFANEKLVTAECGDVTVFGLALPGLRDTYSVSANFVLDTIF
jgi:hypothetical protein